jgi:hypothetical protein
MTSVSGETINYVSWWKTNEASGRLLYGRKLPRTTRLLEHGYSSAPGVAEPNQVRLFFDAIKKNRRLRAESVIVSHESWIQDAQLITSQTAEFEQVDALAFVRPPIPWLNSAYWQWGHWSGFNFPKWSNVPGKWNMSDHLGTWAEQLDGHLTVRPAGKDVFEGLNDFVSAKPEAQLKPIDKGTNQSSPRTLLRVLFRNRHLRSSAHDSSIEFVLSRWCDFSGLAPAWAVTPNALSRLAKRYDPIVKRFFEAFPDCAARCESDPNWLTPEENLMERCEASLDDGRETYVEELQILCERLADGLRYVGSKVRVRTVLEDTDFGHWATEDTGVLEERAVELIELIRALDERYRLGVLAHVKWKRQQSRRANDRKSDGI